MTSWFKVYKEAIEKGFTTFQAASLADIQANLVMSVTLSIMFPNNWEHAMFDSSPTGLLHGYKY